jgi:uncharacterized membrane protein
MTIESFVARVLRVLSIALFIVALFMCYTNLPDTVAVHFAPDGSPDGYLGRESVFYATGGLMVVLNVLLVVLARSLANLPDQTVALLGPAPWHPHPEALKGALRNWLFLGVAALNVFLALCLNALAELNDSTGTETVFNYRYLLTVGAASLLAWLLYLPARLWLTRPSARERVLES